MSTQYIQHLQNQAKPGFAPGAPGKHLVGDRTKLERFLILGTEKGTYYASEKKLTHDAAETIKKLVQDNRTGLMAVQMVVDISDAGRAPKNDQALLALAVAVKHGTPVVRSAALAALPQVARIGTHLFHFLDYAKALDIGWGRSFRRAVAKWYTDKNPKQLAGTLVKYQQRDGWSNRDALRLSHAVPPTLEHQALFHWVVKGEGEGKTWASDSAVATIAAFERAKKVTDVKELVKLITDYRLPREAIPTQFLGSPEVWQALLVDMKPEALIRNLGKLTSVGLLGPLSENVQLVRSKLTNVEELRKARLHPVKALIGMLAYRQGHGIKGDLEWTPNQQVVKILDDAFYAAFGTVEPTGKRIMKCLDVSGSMGSQILGQPLLTCRTAAALMSMVSARVEHQTFFMGFAHRFVPLAVGPGQSLSEVERVVHRSDFGSTDCSLPFAWAHQNNVPVDAFEVYTDNETNYNRIAPSRALEMYRQATGIDAKLVVVGMAVNDISIADPNDAGMLDVAGFDTNAPSIIQDFIRG